MSNIVKVKVSAWGTRPLLQHKFGPEAIPLTPNEKTGVAGNDPEEWRRTCMVTPKGQLYILGSYIFGAFVAGAKHTKKGKGSLQSLVAATLQVEEEQILLDQFVPKNGDPPLDASEPVFIHVSGVRNPTTKGRNVRYRLAANAGWRIQFHLKFDKTIVSRTQMEAIANDTGILVGLADGRSIGYGRFLVDEFEEIAA